MNLKRKTQKKKVSIIGFWFGFDGSEECVYVYVCVVRIGISTFFVS
jgi:hypothetical protein